MGANKESNTQSEADALALAERVFELPTELRSSWLQENYQGQDTLRRKVERLLLADQTARTNLATAGAFKPGASQRVSISGYQLGNMIGSGGMGDVYAAQRDDGLFEQHVAIKVLKGDFTNARLIEQFHVERQILANLQHPNIVTLLDGGTTEQGLPFVVTEHIEGINLSEYICQQQPNLKTRLGLFDQICAAVEHAHQALIIHRDIKPSNVLIQANGQAKLLDFGVAKVLSDEADQQTRISALTPSYASPEQISGDQVSTATDIYSLGAILYFLLTEEQTYETNSASLLEIERLIATGALTKPSVRANKNPKLPSVHQDLDAIALKALAVAPARRYASVSSFRDDIQSFLENKPVNAQLDSAWYRLTKFVVRHRVGFSASVICVIALLASLMVSITQTRVANQQLQRSEAISDFMGDLLMSPASRWDVDLAAGADARMSDVLAVAGDHIVGSFDQHPDVQIDLLSRVAVALDRLSKKELAVQYSRQALAITNTIDSPELRLKALLSHGKNLTRRSRSELGLEFLLDAKRMMEANNETTSRRYLYLLNDLGNAYGTFNRFALQQQTMLQAIAIFDETVGDLTHPLRAGALNNLASAQLNQGDIVGAKSSLTEALAIVSTDRNRDDVVFGYVHLYCSAWKMLIADFAEAERHAKLALESLPKSLGPDSRELAVAITRYAAALTYQGKLVAARQWLNKAELAADNANISRVRDLKATQIILTSFEGKYQQLVDEHKPESMLGEQYAFTQMALFELAVAHMQTGNTTVGQRLLAQVYEQANERYSNTLVPLFDKRLAALESADR